MKTGGAFTIISAHVNKKIATCSELARKLFHLITLLEWADSVKGWWRSARKLQHAYRALYKKVIRRGKQLSTALEELESVGAIITYAYRGGLVMRLALSVEESQRWQAAWARGGREERDGKDGWIARVRAKITGRRSECMPQPTTRTPEHSTQGSPNPTTKNRVVAEADAKRNEKTGRSERPHVVAPNDHPIYKYTRETPTKVNVGVSFSSEETTGARVSEDRAPVSKADHSDVRYGETAPISAAIGEALRPLQPQDDTTSNLAESQAENGACTESAAPDAAVSQGEREAQESARARTDRLQLELLMLAKGIYGTTHVGDYPEFVASALKAPELTETTAKFVADRMRPGTLLKQEMAAVKRKPSVLSPNERSVSPDPTRKAAAVAADQPKDAQERRRRHMEKGLALLASMGLVAQNAIEGLYDRFVPGDEHALEQKERTSEEENGAPGEKTHYPRHLC